MLAPDYAPNIFGGIGVHVVALTEALRRQGHLVDVLAPGHPADDGPLDPTITEATSRIYRWQTAGPPSIHTDPALFELGSPSLFDLQNNVAIAGAQVRDTYDVVHAHDFRTLPAGVVIAQRTGASLVATKHSSPASNWPKLTAAYAEALEAWGFPQCHRVIAVSRSVREVIGRDLGTSVSDRCHVVRNGTGFDPAEHRGPRRAAPDRDSARILFVGRLQGTKGPDLAVACLAHLPAGVTLTIAGDGRMLESLKGQASELGRADDITFAGKVSHSEIEEHYRRADVLLVPSRADTCPITVCEGQALGIPVVASRVGGIPELINHDDTGLLVEDPSPRNLATAVERLLDDPDLWLRLRANGLTQAGTYSWNQIATETAVVYRDAIHDRTDR